MCSVLCLLEVVAVNEFGCLESFVREVSVTSRELLFARHLGLDL
jgi:hypothetical protein